MALMLELALDMMARDVGVHRVRIYAVWVIYIYIYIYTVFPYVLYRLISSRILTPEKP